MNKLGSLILNRSTQGFTSGILLGKLTESISLRPLFIEARIRINFLNPSNVRCKVLFIIKNIYRFLF